MNENQISVVIPTFNRPSFLKRAMESVLKQTYQNIEIIVVVDGISEATELMVDEIIANSTKKITLIQTKDKVGGSEARNIGIRAATGEMIALLDDDDEWFENKLTSQVALLKQKNLTTDTAFLCFTTLLRYKEKDQETYTPLPNVNYEESGKSRITDYLFETEGLRNIGFIQTSTVLVPKWMAIETPFTVGLPKHQDWDWLLKLDKEQKLTIVQDTEPQIIYHSDVPKDTRIGYINRWRFTEQWGAEHRAVFSLQGYDSFILNYVMLSIAEDSQLTKKERVRELKARWKILSFKTKIRPYSWKMIIYMMNALRNG